MGKFKGHDSCPSCGSSDGRAVYEDGTSYCFSCGTYFSGKNEDTGKRKKVMNSFWSFEEIEGLATANLTGRGINKEVAKFYEVKQSVNERTGGPDYFFFPSGKGQGWKVKHHRNKKTPVLSGNIRDSLGRTNSTIERWWR